MPRGFSFQNDIAPMRGSFFQSGLSSREGSYLAKKYGPDMKDVKDMLSIQSQMASIRNSDLAYENNLFALQTAKDKAARERESNLKLPALTAALDDALNADKSPFERQHDIGKITMQYSGLLASSPAAGKILSGANAAVSAGIRGLQYADQKEKEDLAYASGFADPEVRKKLYEKDGVYSPKEQLKEEDILYRQEAKQTEELGELNISQTNKTMSGIKDVGNTLSKMEPALDAATQREAWREQYAGMDNPPKMPTSFTRKYSPVQIQQLKSSMLQMGLDEDQYKDLTPDELHTSLLKTNSALQIELRKKLGLVPKAKPTTKAATLF